MFSINFTATTKKSIILTLFALFFLSCVFLLMIGSTFHIMSPPKEYLGIDNTGETAAQRVEVLTHLGYNVNSSTEESENIRIPIELSDVYNNYNELQKENGTDLLNYRGAECVRYTYINEDNDMNLNIIVYDGRIIGGDECSTELDGEMKPLRQLGMRS